MLFSKIKSAALAARELLPIDVLPQNSLVNTYKNNLLDRLE